MVLMLRTALAAAMALAFFGQHALGAPGMEAVDKRMALKDPQKFSGNVVGSVSTGVLINDKQIKSIAASELTAFESYIKTNKLTASKGISIYLKPTERKIIVAAIGAGSGMHGEQNVKTVCEASGIAFTGGDILTYTHQYGFMTACKEPDKENPDRRNCAALIRDANINDIGGRLKG